ncbi:MULTISPECIES: helix-turn-helix transcriptional regulator [Brevibacterium]|uniref:Helix-turn-helix domain-containing protein n=1 Tax=Brevibacterium casei TaxID=33889 RepID=A0A7T4DKR0_9MICO|nr:MULTISPECIES: helix-turn-helix transcriptional regulator [Brevibacterium]QQB15696.1 helix-turn-helix domain-containing protein [Brevibacterium casei]
MAQERTSELGRFLRSRRDRVRPCDVGLAKGTRRRVPGLRREEVAVLANIGTSWYTWLEQGREVHPSESVLEAIAEALLLDREERAHLFLLGGYPDRATNPGDSEVGEQLRMMLDEVLPLPAMVTDPTYTIRAYNEVERYLTTDLAEVAPADRNCVIQAYENPEWASIFQPIDEHKRLLVAKMRAAYAESLEDPEWGPLLERLSRYPDFRALWDSGNVGRTPGRTKVVENPYVGTLNLTMATLIAQENQRLTLSVYLPVDSVTRARLETLHGWIRDGSIEKKRAEVVAEHERALATAADGGDRPVHLRVV